MYVHTYSVHKVAVQDIGGVFGTYVQRLHSSRYGVHPTPPPPPLSGGPGPQNTKHLHSTQDPATWVNTRVAPLLCFPAALVIGRVVLVDG